MRSYNILILLNYNDYEDTLKFVNEHSNLKELNKIIVVDNCSLDNSYFILQNIFKNNNKIDIIQSSNNGGYSSGNNFGIKYALKNYKPDNFIIANPDTRIDYQNFNGFMRTVYHLTNTYPNRLGIVAPMTVSLKTSDVNVGWKQPNILDDIISNLMVINKIKRKFIFKKRKYNKDYIKIDVVLGAFFLVTAKSIIDVGLFDDQTFLYCEENILSFKLKKKGYKNFVDLHTCYYHNHNYDRSVFQDLSAFWELNRSEQIYHSKYLKINNFQKFIFATSIFIGFLERIVYFKFKDKNWK